MPTLADPVLVSSPPRIFFDSISDLSHAAKTLLWYGLAQPTRASYKAAITSFEAFCRDRGQTPWPAQQLVLEEWVTGRIMGSASPKQGRVKPDTVAHYLSALLSYHVDHNLPTAVFESKRIQRIIQGGRSMFPAEKSPTHPITKDTLEKITNPHIFMNFDTLDSVNISTALKVGWAGFLRMGEFTHTGPQAKRASFQFTKLTRSDISFASGDNFATLRLKRSKSDVKHAGVEIILAATGDSTCPVLALRHLFQVDPKPPASPLFSLQQGSFDRHHIINAIHKRMLYHRIPINKVAGHSLRKGAAQHASDMGMVKETIQILGRWRSDACKAYYKSSVESRYNLSLRFQTGITPSLHKKDPATPNTKTALLPVARDTSSAANQQLPPPPLGVFLLTARK